MTLNNLKQNLIDGFYHKSVLLKEALDLLQVKKNQKYIDATLGGGGHTKEVLKLGGIVLGIDTDSEAIEYVKKTIDNSNLTLAQGNFKDIKNIAQGKGFKAVAGIIYDLGVSSFQINEAMRGFSFQSEGPLDMRMDRSSGIAASDLANLSTKDELQRILSEYGEEPRSKSIAEGIVKRRKDKAIKTTQDLVEIIKEAYGVYGEITDKKRADLSKRVFQAFRIFVNSEIENLKKSLPEALELLEDGGRIVAISFHSLEDRVIKQSFREFEIDGKGIVLTKGPVVPGEAEIKENPRARSAKLRAFEKRI